MGFEAYLKAINGAYQKGNATEHTHRPALKGLIETLGKKLRLLINESSTSAF